MRPINALNDLVRIACTEMAIAFGMVRYWVLVLSSYLFAIVLFVLNSAAHANYSAYSASINVVSPRDGLLTFNEICLTIFITLIVLLSVDVRARDGRNRMIEVLDSRPYGNAALVFGKFLGIFGAVWLPLVLLMVVVDFIGWFLPLSGASFGGALDPVSMIGFAIYMAIPALAFCGAFAMSMAFLLRNRFLALAMTAILIFVDFSLMEGKSYAAALTLDLLGTAQVDLPSEWSASIADWQWWLQRAGILLLAFGLLSFCTVIHPRLDKAGRARQSVATVLLLLVGLVSIVGAYQWQVRIFQKVSEWRVAHESKLQTSRVDILDIKASVTIEPGKNMSVETGLEFQGQEGALPDKAVFTLNPGFQVTEIQDDIGNSLPFSHHDGLLEVTLVKPLASGEQSRLTLRYQGVPDIHFGYLDSAICLCERTEHTGMNALEELGTDVGIFSNRYVALMPGLRWLPSSGPDVGRDDLLKFDRDFYHLNMRVSVPEGWEIAGPGLGVKQRQEDGYIEFEFSPNTVVPEVALLTAPFEKVSTKVRGIQFDLLLHPEHRDVVKALQPGKAEIEKWLESRLALAEDSGLIYPFEAFTLVEVPNRLRGYTGGWRMDTSLAPPAMVLVKEKGFPTARFDVSGENMFSDLLGWNPTPQSEVDGVSAIRSRLLRYFSNDFSGGNIFSGFARSIFYHQTSASGEGGIALDFAMNELATLVVSGERSYFSVENALSIDETLNRILEQDQRPHKSTTEKVIEHSTSRPVVWEAALATPLHDINPWKNPAVMTDVLALKSGQLARIIYDILGAREAGRLLSDILNGNRGGSYRLADLLEITNTKAEQLGALLHTWFHDIGLAGFKADQVELFQLGGAENGRAEYQFEMRLMNSEPAAGYVRVSWVTDGDQRRNYSDPIRLEGNSAIKYGMVLSKTPTSVYVAPYLSLNREEYRVKEFTQTGVSKETREPFDGIRPIPPVSNSTDRLIIDDLDDAFEVINPQKTGLLAWLNPTQRFAAESLDQGVPVGEGMPRHWSRRNVASAWGNYRHTVVYAQAGDGAGQVNFSAQLPYSGRWQLDISVPELEQLPLYKLGIWNLTIAGNGKAEEIKFDANDARAGWNTVGEYELNAGRVDVILSNQSNGDVVIADAVAWVPIQR